MPQGPFPEVRVMYNVTLTVCSLVMPRTLTNDFLYLTYVRPNAMTFLRVAWKAEGWGPGGIVFVFDREITKGRA